MGRNFDTFPAQNNTCNTAYLKEISSSIQIFKDWYWHLSVFKRLCNPILAALKSCSTIHTSIRDSARFSPCGGLFCIYWRIKAVYMKELFVGFFGLRGCHRRIYGQFCWSQASHQSVSSKLESDTCTTSITWDLQAYRGYDRHTCTIRSIPL